ncbi:MAG: hypothetical protein EOO50_12345 [Flavobacterium sp.]|uniref:hypothetical protein n=1 Tax=Flavobacterium sp. TaxID=239 RepID=UPI001208D56D|nr:hypothetical protein [Flavobacterium sp.]RZJ65798.1 MAG: hypothetical protein EOO50_12345 [Flavobacterium sp.]
MGIEWIFLGTIVAVFAFCMFRWISFGFRFGGNKILPFLLGLLLFTVSFFLFGGLHFLLMETPFVSRFYHDTDLQLANVIFVSVTMGFAIIAVSESIRNRKKAKNLKSRHFEIDLIGSENNDQ